jgi:hypothetical protein
MVEWTTHEKLSLLGCVVVIIGSLLPWWSFTEKDLGLTLSFININPITGHASPITFVLSSDYLYPAAGVIALAGAVLLFEALKKPWLGVLGGSLALFGLVFFMILIQLDVPNIAGYLGPPQTNAFVYISFLKNYGIPGYGLTLDIYVTYGSIIVLAGGIIGILAYSKREGKLSS